MIPRILIATITSVFMGTSLLLSGCATSEEPQALTGQEERDAFVQSRAGRFVPAPMAEKGPAATADAR